MNFLLSKTIVSKRGKCVYKLYEFKLAPGHYHAELVSPTDGQYLAQINFTKDLGKWYTPVKSVEAKRLVKILGHEIDKLKN